MCHMPHATCLCKLRSELRGAEEAWQGRSKGTCESRTKCERDSLIYGQQRIKTRHRHRYQIYTHTHRYNMRVCVCVCVCVARWWRSEKSPRKLQLPKDSFSLKIYDVCPQEEGQGDECVCGGVGAWQNEAFGVTFVLRDNFGATEKFSASASASVFGLIDAALLLLTLSVSISFSVFRSCCHTATPLGNHSAPLSLPLCLMRYKHINCEKCQASHITLDVFCLFSPSLISQRAVSLSPSSFLFSTPSFIPTYVCVTCVCVRQQKTPPGADGVVKFSRRPKCFCILHFPNFFLLRSICSTSFSWNSDWHKMCSHIWGHVLIYKIIFSICIAIYSIILEQIESVKTSWILSSSKILFLWRL